MKRKFLIFVSIICLFGLNTLFSQDNPVLLTVAGEKITRDEFLAVYNKNNVQADVIDKKSLEEYLELFINFRLKVKEAEELGMDTAKSFVQELSGYRKQLAQPYLTDKDVTENLIKEAYERMKTDIRASHILMRVAEDALPKDTLEAWNKIMNIRKRILDGEDFGKLAYEYSEDPSARDRAEAENRPAIKGNSGDLGYFTVLQMYYPFETGAYNTKINDISMPVRTPLGYHIIKPTAKRESLGQVQVAHIMLRTNPGVSDEEANNVREKAFEIYKKIQEGSDFAELAKQYSEDRGSAGKGGILPWFGTGRMVPEFDSATFALKKAGDVSKPTQSIYGWHIIKLLERKPLPTWDEAKAELRVKIQKDGRSNLSKIAIINKIKKEYKFKENKKNLAPVYAQIDSSYYIGQWEYPKMSNLKKPLFTLAKQNYTQSDFMRFIESRQTPGVTGNIEQLINKQYIAFVEETCLTVENEKLEEKYPEFKALMREYRDGILLFELTDQKVWSKAVKDTMGLQEFHNENKLKYMWGKRLNADIYSCQNPETATLLREQLKAFADAPDTVDVQKEVLNALNAQSQLNVRLISGLFQADDHDVLSKIEWEKGLTPNVELNGLTFVVNVHDVELPRPKTLDEAKGIITADYQARLEARWIADLKAKFPVQVDKKVFDAIK